MQMIGLLALSGALGVTAKPATPTLKKLTEFDLPGPPGKRFDYLTIDPDDRYLLSAHLAAGQMYVIDLRTNKIVATVTDTPGAEGVGYVPELKKAYTSNAYDNTILIPGPYLILLLGYVWLCLCFQKDFDAVCGPYRDTSSEKVGIFSPHGTFQSHCTGQHRPVILIATTQALTRFAFKNAVEFMIDRHDDVAQIFE
jgi:hypothetical protein